MASGCCELQVGRLWISFSCFCSCCFMSIRRALFFFVSASRVMEGYGTVAIWDSEWQRNLGVWSWDCGIWHRG